jgi:hypothetical protein
MCAGNVACKRLHECTNAKEREKICEGSRKTRLQLGGGGRREDEGRTSKMTTMTSAKTGSEGEKRIPWP